MGGSIVEDLGRSCSSCQGTMGLGCGQGAEGHQHCVVNRPGIVEEDPNDLLQALGACFVKGSGEIRGIGELDRCTILGFGPGVGGVLSLGWFLVGKPLQSSLNITRHGHINMSLLIVPSKSHSKKGRAREVSGYLILKL